MKTRLLFPTIAILATAQIATAQASEGDSGEATHFTFSRSDQSVTLTQDPSNPSGAYQNFTPIATGDGVNSGNNTSSNFDWATGGYAGASCQSNTTTLGTAANFQGFAYNIQITNTSNVIQSVTWNLDVVEDVWATGGEAMADGYGGWELNGYKSYAWFTNTVHQDGSYLTSPGNSAGVSAFTGGLVSAGPPYDAFHGTESNTINMVAGETDYLQIWSSGDTLAVSPVPEPASFTPLGLGLLGIVLVRRNRKG